MNINTRNRHELPFEELDIMGPKMKGIIIGGIVTYIVQAILFERLPKQIAQKLGMPFLNDDIISSLLFLIMFFLLTAIIMLINHTTGIYYYFYYSLWKKRSISLVKPAYRGSMGNEEKALAENLLNYNKISIKDSYREQVIGKKKKVIRPVVIKKEHMHSKWYWPKWAFEILLLDRKPRIVKEDKGVYALKVNLTDSKYGIYNNEGKKYLDEKFLVTEKDREDYEAKSREIYEYISSGKSLPEPEFPEPIRWASGGVLPIVEVDNKCWVALFFRNINPIGLNVANGASESAKEYLNPKHIIFREFCEEFMLIDGGHTSVANEITQKLFKLEVLDGEDKVLINPKFAKQHKRKRLEQDNLLVKEDEKNAVKVEAIHTNFKVDVTGPKSNTSISNIIFTVNPNEFGIEITRMVKFEMTKQDYILNGEVMENFDTLVRMPVIMISLKYLYEVYKENNKSLGSIAKEKPYMDSKTLETVPAGEYKIFYHDIELREKYVEKLKKIKGKQGELDFHQQWLNKYGETFKKIRKENPDLNSVEHKPLITLCPVTWKTLELAFRYNYLKEYIK